MSSRRASPRAQPSAPICRRVHGKQFNLSAVRASRSRACERVRRAAAARLVRSMRKQTLPQSGCGRVQFDALQGYEGWCEGPARYLFIKALVAVWPAAPVISLPLSSPINRRSAGRVRSHRRCVSAQAGYSETRNSKFVMRSLSLSYQTGQNPERARALMREREDNCHINVPFLTLSPTNLCRTLNS
ncbi:hypothetical protein MSG28_004547 [Choristoneura fumiferana]|uniref:Uncharacterized protein n=1 Tax=Choristoneura fumiferana TaxID=7141 RepID=A0ACC0K6C5_CHOFU|nr:hypothetical protein MSG28_004547 [Choristoneura fumiferana]